MRIVTTDPSAIAANSQDLRIDQRFTAATVRSNSRFSYTLGTDVCDILVGVIPVGSTGPLGVEWVLALNQPFERPRIQVKFTERLEPDGVRLDQITLDPPVDNLRLVADS